MVKTETLKQWVRRINREPVWREVAFLIDAYSLQKDKTGDFKAEICEQLAQAFTVDVFSPHWTSPPSHLELEISNQTIRHTQTAILHARKEIAKRVPVKEQLWRSLYILYEESKGLKAHNKFLEDRIVELESQLEV
ncbi:hypothetical protein LCGC14_1889700 [marine sediment metagenome]|uniref:Uncharacterized protein n=1 Tax=marine sediment metagenome TaxID=412755 RepID=A0A0F9GN10_9ZZZZ